MVITLCSFQTENMDLHCALHFFYYQSYDGVEYETNIIPTKNIANNISLSTNIKHYHTNQIYANVDTVLLPSLL